MASKEHLDLANTIKKVHIELRLKARQDGADKAWNEHVKQSEQLQDYASAMLKLATEYWDKNNLNSSSLCRIQWVIGKCCDYFLNGGLKSSIEKECRLNKKYFGTELFSVDNNYLDSFLKGKNDKLYLLDVGSCYNPFKKCDRFHTVPIDLVPATEDVIQCDFLNVNVLPKIEISDINNPCLNLPESTFDIVVFSLLLEYFPSSKQRWTCCKKAYCLLKSNGILVILTPDSKHATANSRIIKYWRYALADIGFLLVCYEKLKHLHCLLYRKCITINVPKHWLSLQIKSEDISLLNFEDMINIPQDFHEYVNESSDLESIVFNTNSDSEYIANCFNELPDSSSDLFN